MHYKVKITIPDKFSNVVLNLYKHIIRELDYNFEEPKLNEKRKSLNVSNMIKDGFSYEYPITSKKVIKVTNKQRNLFKKWTITKEDKRIESNICGYIYQINNNCIYVKVKDIFDTVDVIDSIFKKFGDSTNYNINYNELIDYITKAY